MADKVTVICANCGREVDINDYEVYHYGGRHPKYECFNCVKNGISKFNGRYTESYKIRQANKQRNNQS